MKRYLISFVLPVKLEPLQYGNDDVRCQSVGNELFRSEKPNDWPAQEYGFQAAVAVVPGDDAAS